MDTTASTAVSPPPGPGQRGRPALWQARPGGRQQGSVAVMSAVLVVPLLAFCALAIDIGLVYNRAVEMRNIAHAVALSAARKLNGTTTGVNDAMTAAQSTAAATLFKNRTEAVNWSTSAISFSTSPGGSGGWVDASGASSAAGGMFYVKVDTSAFEDAGRVSTVLIRVLFPSLTEVLVNSSVVAGRVSVEVAPIAICAMSPTPAAPRTYPDGTQELVEYGFRRGVSYDLMQLNPLGDTALNFVIDPTALPGTAGTATGTSATAVGPYACAGRLGFPRILGATVAVSQPFPLSELYNHLNARFDQYKSTPSCTSAGAPPDANIKPFSFNKIGKDSTFAFPWMKVTPAGQAARTESTGGKRQTYADLPPGTDGAALGPLWLYARAVPYSAYKPGVAEPVAGYAGFATSAWTTLYPGQVIASHPSTADPKSLISTVYSTNYSSNVDKPAAAHAPAFRGRRVLNVPLLACASTPSGTATVSAVGRFFMTVPADGASLPAEFAGILPPERIDGSVVTFP